jgi:thiol-disulfide isomerase/thioredoxin
MKRHSVNFSHWARQSTCLLLVAGTVGLCAAQSQGAPLQLELPQLDGASFARLSDFPQGLVVLNFWRSDCPPCVAEMPLLSRLSLAHPEVQFVGIATEEAARARRFVNNNRAAYPQWLAPAVSDGLMRRFGNTTGALPHTVVLNGAHQICQLRTGALDADWLEKALLLCSRSFH